MRYEFWVVRYVPSSVRGEFINIGVIAGRDGEWDLRVVSHLGRASRLGGSAAATRNFLARIEASIESQLHEVTTSIEEHRQDFGRGDLEDLRVRMNNIVQISPPRAVLANSAEEAAETAFDLMIVDIDHEIRNHSRTMVVMELREAFGLRPELVPFVARSQTAAVGEQRARVDFAVQDGNVRQLSQVWAFDVKNTRNLEVHVQAWNYLMSLVRQDGGRLEARGRSATLRAGWAIPNDVEMNAIYTRPTTDEGARQLRVAQDGWRRTGIHAVESSEAISVVDRAQSLVACT